MKYFTKEDGVKRREEQAETYQDTNEEDIYDVIFNEKKRISGGWFSRKMTEG